MGLFTTLLTLPLAPVRGVVWVTEQVADEIDRELYDEANIRREMLALELDYEDGKIDDQKPLQARGKAAGRDISIHV